MSTLKQLEREFRTQLQLCMQAAPDEETSRAEALSMIASDLMALGVMHLEVPMYSGTVKQMNLETLTFE